MEELTGFVVLRKNPGCPAWARVTFRVEVDKESVDIMDCLLKPEVLRVRL